MARALQAFGEFINGDLWIVSPGIKETSVQFQVVELRFQQRSDGLNGQPHLFHCAWSYSRRAYGAPGQLNTHDHIHQLGFARQRQKW